LHVTNVYRYWERCDFFCCLVAGLSTGISFSDTIHEQEKKNIKISLDFFLNQKNLRWHLSKHIIPQYSIEHTKDEMMMMLQGLYYLSLYYVSILFWYSITHLFLSIFFPLHSSMKTSTATTKTATLPIFLLLLAKKYKEQVEKEEWEAFKL